MKWMVIYRPSAKRELAEIWLNAGDKQFVTDEADSVDQILGRDPSTAGESREGVMRLLIEPPLAVVFDVRHDDRIVEVWHVKEWR